MATASKQVSYTTIGAIARVITIVLAPLALVACATIKVQPPDKPIEINLNIKIEQEVRVRLDREIDDILRENPDIF